MKKIYCLAVFATLLFLCAGAAQAQDRKEKRRAVTDEMRAQMAQRATNAMEGKSWMIYVVPAEIAGKKQAAAETDILTFKDGTVTSKNLSASGYRTSNFSMRVQDDGVAIWETMQNDGRQNRAFLRGELEGSEMKGSLTLKNKAGAKKAFYFGTTAP